MKIGIISAMEKERRLITPLISDAKEYTLDNQLIIRGRIGQNEIILTKCGIGKVNAAINTYKLIREFEPDLIINTGVAGGASLQSKIGDILVADYVAYHDVWCGPGTQPGQVDGMDVFYTCYEPVIKASYEILGDRRFLVGLICSGDKFITSEKEIREINSLFPQVLAVDMESASIAQVCYMENVNFNIIRVISDTPGSGENIDQYTRFWEEAPEKTFKLIESLIQLL